MLSFYTNKEFYYRISFNFNIIDYIITRKRLNAIKIKDIIDYMQYVFIYIHEKLKRSQLIIIEQINYYKKDITFKKNDLVFFYSKNIIINKLFKKLNDKMFDSFRIIFIINFF